MQTSTIEIGRVIRFGRGWADVSVDRKVRRVPVRPDLLIRVGDSLMIVHDQAMSCLRPPQ